MIYRLIDLPSNVIGFNALWDISEKDFDEVLVPSVEQHIVKTRKFNCLIIFSNPVRFFWVNTLKVFKRLMNWKAKCRRVAIVIESKTERFFINSLTRTFSNNFKVFSITEIEKAIAWAAQENKR